MSSIRKWIASKMFPPLSTGGNGQTNGSVENGLPFFRSFSRNSTSGGSSTIVGQPSSEYSTSRESNSEQSYFSSIYSHYHSVSSKQNSSLTNQCLVDDLYQFYSMNEELNYISTELDTFDGRSDTIRCSALVSALKLAQDRVITLIFRIMDEIGCERATREYRLKFPDELIAGEGVESLNSQIWFGAECLAAGSTITNNQAESNYLRPIANNLTATLEQVRYDLRGCCDYLPKRPKISRDLRRRLENFDLLFTSFEYDYVKAMLPIKSADDIESLQELTFLFSETLSYSLRRNLILKEDVEGCQPSVMIALPRLSIVRGLLHGYGSVVCKHHCDELSSILRPYHSLLLKFHEFLINLNDEEIDFLEQLLSNNYQSNDLSLTNDDIICEYANNQIDFSDQSNLLNYYNKFMKCAKKYHNHNHPGHRGRVKYSKASLNKYISSSVDLLLINNKSDDGIINQANNRYSPLKPHKMLFRSFSLPNLNLDCGSLVSKASDVNSKESKARFAEKTTSTPSSSSSSSTYASTNSSLESSSSNSYPNFSLITSSSSASSLSNELDFFNQFKEILKRSHRSSIARHRFNGNTSNVRSFSSNCPPTAAFSDCTSANDNSNERRAMTTTGVRLEQATDSNEPVNFAPGQLNTATPAASTFSNNSIHFDLDSIHFDELTQLTICKKKILHQVFVMISKIADKFQTNYASELRNILRTVFMLQEMEESEKLAKEEQVDRNDVSFVQPVDVQLAHYSSDNVDLDVEEGIDANEYLMGPSLEPASQSIATSSQTSQPVVQEPVRSNCDACDSPPATAPVSQVYSNIATSTPTSQAAHRSNSLEETPHSRKHQHSSSDPCRDHRSNALISSSYPSIKESACSTAAGDSPSLTVPCSSKACSQSLPSLLDRNSPSVAPGSHQTEVAPAPASTRSASSTTSLSSSHSLQPSQFTSSTATTVDERFDLPTFYLPHTDSFNSTSYFAHSMMPISESASEPSYSAARNLLLPPTWIPDELVSTCSLCAQVFNLIRRRHHCRRCGNIFCHQCSNNFVSLKCFGYAKPVRVCNRCLVLHEQQQQQQQQSLNQHVPSTATTS